MLKKQWWTWTIENPALGQMRVSQELLQRGIMVSAGGVRSIWIRHELETMGKRLKALEARSAPGRVFYSQRARYLLLKKQNLSVKPMARSKHTHPGYLGAQDTYFVGTMKGVGRIYQQTFIDTYSRVAFAKLYLEKTAITAADMLNDQSFDEQEIVLLRILTDRGTETR